MKRLIFILLMIREMIYTHMPYIIGSMATWKPPHKTLNEHSPNSSMVSKIWKNPMTDMRIEAAKAMRPVSFTHAGAFHAASRIAIRRRVMILM